MTEPAQLPAAQLVGRNVRRLRTARRWTQTDLSARIAAHLGTTWSRQTVSAAEQGGREWTAAEVMAAAQAFAVPVAELFDPTKPICPTCGREMDTDE